MILSKSEEWLVEDDVKKNLSKIAQHRLLDFNSVFGAVSNRRSHGLFGQCRNQNADRRLTSQLSDQADRICIDGLGSIWFFASLNLDKLRTKGILGLSFGILLLALLFVKVAGRAVNGANGWINLGPISIQPAEFTKLFMIVYWADRCTKVNDELHRPSMQDYVSGLILTAILLILIIIQPDVGGFSINFAIAALIIMASGYNSRWTILIFDGLLLIGMVALPSLAKVVATGHIKNYQVARFVAFVNPFGTQSGAGSQLVNSYYAISNGGLKGVGLGNGIQKMGYLPEPNTDFILSVVSEELGFIGVFLILALLAVIICQIIRVGVRSDNMYEGLLCYGVGTFIAVEAATLGGGYRSLPITGVRSHLSVMGDPV